MVNDKVQEGDKRGLRGILIISISEKFSISLAVAPSARFFFFLSCASGNLIHLSRRPNVVGFLLLPSISIFNPYVRSASVCACGDCGCSH